MIKTGEYEVKIHQQNLYIFNEIEQFSNINQAYYFIIGKFKNKKVTIFKVVEKQSIEIKIIVSSIVITKNG